MKSLSTRVLKSSIKENMNLINRFITKSTKINFKIFLFDFQFQILTSHMYKLKLFAKSVV